MCRMTIRALDEWADRIYAPSEKTPNKNKRINENAENDINLGLFRRVFDPNEKR